MSAQSWLIIVGLILTPSCLYYLQKLGWIDLRNQKVRRGTGHVFLGFQEFVQPSIEHVFEAENVEQKAAEAEGQDDAPYAQARERLALLLALDPIDLIAIRYELSYARRAGLDWRALYQASVQTELKLRPYRTPSIPPINRVSPGIDDDDLMT